jgi:glutathione S-transferase
MEPAKPLLYSFRRCPFAIRARLAIAASGIEVNVCEVDLREKPAALLAASPKGTVPVLQFTDGRVIDESLAIMRWALAVRDPEGWLAGDSDEARALITRNDGPFKRDLDRYKYAGRTAGATVGQHRAQAEVFPIELEARLATTQGLCGDRYGLADFAILPFVRQFSMVDPAWFCAAPYPQLRRWLAFGVDSARFRMVMQKPAPAAD